MTDDEKYILMCLKSDAGNEKCLGFCFKRKAREEETKENGRPGKNKGTKEKEQGTRKIEGAETKKKNKRKERERNK